MISALSIAADEPITLDITTTLLWPIGLGLFGFIEPCTVGAHLIFLGSQEDRDRAARVAAFGIFVVSRVGVMAAFGALVALVGRTLVDVQTALWLVFGTLYVLIGLAYLTSMTARLKRSVALVPDRWSWARNPAVQGVAFGLNIPACAAPLVFALIGLVANAGTVATGAATMAIFAAALSLPLAPMMLWPSHRAPLLKLANLLRGRRWPLAVIFMAVGAWSIWFGLYVDPADWAGR